MHTVINALQAALIVYTMASYIARTDVKSQDFWDLLALSGPEIPHDL